MEAIGAFFGTTWSSEIRSNRIWFIIRRAKYLYYKNKLHATQDKGSKKLRAKVVKTIDSGALELLVQTNKLKEIIKAREGPRTRTIARLEEEIAVLDRRSQTRKKLDSLRAIVSEKGRELQIISAKIPSRDSIAEKRKRNEVK
ncbi:hypothetical protein EG328_000273 [Venturia inaequalis]|uniref:Uncharacterized protein n=1 Tax=Venturia inaequalis TaxID=5025 RepID=A0A8H3U3M9_VENIN|nr:hypothetical protein EG328_000273 [Venturia inaequalis]